MTITLSQIDSWNIESIEEVFDRCTRIRDECVRLDDTLKDVGRREGWGGAAALAAEAYSEREGEATRTLLTDDADNKSRYGPLLELGSYHVVGEKPEGFDELFDDKAGPGSRAVVPHLRVDGTTSGAPSGPPQTIVVK